MEIDPKKGKILSILFFVVFSLIVITSIVFGYMKIIVHKDFKIFTSDEDIELYAPAPPALEF